MAVGDYLAGVGLLALTLAGVLYASFAVIRARQPDLTGLPRGLACALLAIAFLVAVHLFPAAMGVLSRGTVVVAAIGVALIASRLPQRPEQANAPPAFPPPAGGDTRASRVLAAIGGVAAAAYVVGMAVPRAVVPIDAIDALNFHLPGVGRWIQSGSFWQIDQFVPSQAHGNYPQNGDVLQLAVMLPWHNDALVRLVELPLIAIFAIAVYALARELRAPATTSVLASAALVTVPAVAVSAINQAQVDSAFLATYTTGLLFLARHRRTDATADLMLAGVGLGLAFGSKWFGVSSVIAIVAIWTGSRLLARVRPATVLRQTAAVTGLIAATGGFWLVRNWVESGNPVFPVRVAPFGMTVFDAPRDRIRELVGFSISDYAAGDLEIWREEFIPAFLHSAGILTIVALAGVAGALWIAVARRRAAGDGPAGAPERGTTLTGVAAATVLAAVYAVTPYTATGFAGQPTETAINVRYLVPTLIVMSVLTATVARGRGWSRIALEGALLVAVGDGIRRGLDALGVAPGDAAGMLAVLALATGGLLALGRLPRGRPPNLTRPAALAAALALSVVVVGAGYAQQSRVNQKRYSAADPVFAHVEVRAPSGATIGLAGEWSVTGIAPPWPLFGERIENDVAYLGEFRRELLQPYRTGRAFAAGLRRAQPDLVVVGLGALPRQRVREDAWLAAAGYRPVVSSERLRLYRASGTAAVPALGPRAR